MSYCYEDPLEDFEDGICGIIEGGANAIGVLLDGHTVDDPSDDAQIAANVTSGKLKIIKDISFTIEKAAAVLSSTNIPCKQASLLSYDRTGTYYSETVSATNALAHGKLFKANNIKGLLVYECGAANSGQPQLTWINSPVRITGSRVLPAAEQQSFQADAAWRDIDEPTIHVPPSNFLNF